jgi:hypothetical protein
MKPRLFRPEPSNPETAEWPDVTHDVVYNAYCKLVDKDGNLITRDSAKYLVTKHYDPPDSGTWHLTIDHHINNMVMQGDTTYLPVVVNKQIPMYGPCLRIKVVRRSEDAKLVNIDLYTLIDELSWMFPMVEFARQVFFVTDTNYVEGVEQVKPNSLLHKRGRAVYVDGKIRGERNDILILPIDVLKEKRPEPANFYGPDTISPSYTCMPDEWVEGVTDWV